MLRVLGVIITIVALPVAAFLYSRSGGTISGTILDCKTGQGVGGATIRARQIGWGFSPNLVWDKAYDATTNSQARGYFSLHVPIRKPAELLVTKDNYVNAMEWREPGSHESIRILFGNSDIFHKSPGYIIYTENCMVQ